MSSTRPPLGTFSFMTPRRVLFGLGAVEKAGEEARELGGRRVLIVTDRVVEELGLLERVKRPLEEAGFDASVFDGVEPEPRTETADAVAEAVREAKYDIVVGLGGGSSLDMAKVASLMATNPGRPERYLGAGLVRRRGLPMVLVPTTAGTGSEATQNIVVTHEGRKASIASPHAIPDTAIVDPTLTVTMPPGLTANTGLDALSHAVEAYMSKEASPFTDALALEAVRLIAGNLPVAYSQGENLGARYHMSLAALLAGIALSNAGVCGGHALAYGFAVREGLPHGYSCAVALPYIMAYNAPACLTRLAKVARAMGERVSGLSPREAASRAVEAVARLNSELGIAPSLRELKVPRDAIPAIAQGVLVERLLARNPRPITSQDALRIVEGMWEGRLA